MVIAYLGIGSNLGKRKKNIQKAVHLLANTSGIKVEKISSLYESEPVGWKNQPWFINGVIKIKTTFPAEKLLNRLLEIEKFFGRKRSKTNRGGPRIIDLDLLLYGKEIIKIPGRLQVPHPEMEKRKFVLLPLNEINPRIYHPKLKKTVHQLLSKIKNNPDQVIKILTLHKIRSGSLITQISKRLHRC